ncbi:MAG TPA: pyridoxal-phosphate dependent enzyme [Candidatus Limnocylindrales bacterium]|nr:pyridoxal-phosphate dependent enzyme [Candidatus Limnocylindrales bacterium]
MGRHAADGRLLFFPSFGPVRIAGRPALERAIRAANVPGGLVRRLGLERELVDPIAYERTVARFRDGRVALPTFAQLADPTTIPPSVRDRLAAVDPDAPDPLNLFRAHWFNAPDRRTVAAVPAHVVLPPTLTGVDAPIVVLLADRFPMIRSHKVLAAYGCLVPRLVTGQFDPTTERAVWPSTGNYCRGGVAISRILGCRGVAVLPEGMSRERFDWLGDWVVDPDDVIRTPGTESNVKEIYDRCAELDREPDTVIFNQFSEFGNHIAHHAITGRAAEVLVARLAAERPAARLRAFVAATGSAGTIAAGDYLKEHLGSRTVAVEALECPTMLANGFGEHNIQGIGDKHIPLIHDVMATDVVVGVSDRATDRLAVLFASEVGRDYLRRRRGVDDATITAFDSFGLSSICNVVAAIKTARYEGYGPDDLVVTVATDGAPMYATERARILARDFPSGFDAVAAGETYGEFLAGARTDNVLELRRTDRERIFNLGYYTWVEQRGVPVEEFEARRDPAFWTTIRAVVGEWDRRVEALNERTGVLAALDRRTSADR